jgi:phage-related protein
MAQRNTVQIIINAKDDASAILGGVGGALEGLGKAALAGAAVVAGAAVGIGAAITKLAVVAAPLQGVSAAFEGLAESANIGADEMLAALEAGSAGMISQRDLMTSFNKAAQLVSVDFAQTLPDAMGSLGKVAAATGEDMGFLLDSLVTGVGRLSPMILDNLGIQVNLTEASEAWAEANGVAVEEMTKSQQQAALTAQVMEKLAENTAAMPDVAGTATASLASMDAMIQNLKDQIGVAFIPALQAVLEPILEIATDAGPKLIEWAQVAGEWLGRNLPSAIRAVEELLKGNLAGAMSLVRAIVFRTFGSEGTAVFDEWVSKIQTGIQNVIEFFNGVVLPAFDEVRAWFVENWPIIQAVALTAFEVIKDIALTVADVFKTQVLPSFQRAFDNLTNALATLGLDWADVWQAIKTALAITAAAIGAIIVGIIAVFTGLANAIAGTVEFITRQFQKGADAIRNITEGIALVLTGNWEGVRQILEGIGQAISAGFSLTFGTILNAVKEFAEGVFEFFVGLKDQLVGNSIVPDMMSEMLSIITDVFAEILDSIRDALSSAVRAVSQKLGAMHGAVVSMIGRMAEFIRSQIGLFIQIGSELIGGLSEGIMLKVNSILGLIRNLINGLINEAKSALEEFSPSRVFIEIGKNISLGLAVGIEDSFEVALAALLKGFEGLKLTGAEKAAQIAKLFRDLVIQPLLEAGQAFGSLGGAAAAILQSRTVDPLSDMLDGLNERIGGLLESILATDIPGGVEHLLGKSTEQLRELLHDVLNPRQIPGGGFPGINTELAETIKSVLILRDLEQERADATQEVLEAERAIAELQRQQENLAFLQQQIALLDLIAERGLDAEAILGGLQLGIDADVLAVTQAMSAAMAEIIQQTEEQLGIASPSRVFQNIGAQLMMGLAQGVRDAEFIPQQAAGDATAGMVQTVNNNTVNMTVNTQATTSNVMADMQTARALLGI